MTRRWWAGAIAVGLAVVRHEPAAGQSRSAFDDERRELDRRIEVLARVLPDAFDPARAEDDVRVLARQAGIEDLGVRPWSGASRLREADGQPGPVEVHRLEVSGRDRHQKVHEFLDRALHQARLVDVEALRLTAAAEDTVRFKARLGLPSFTGPTGAGESDETVRRADIPVAEREAFLRDTQLVRVKAGVVDRLRDRRSRALQAVAAVTREARDDALALTEVRFDGTLALEGVVAGRAARAGLQATLERAGLTVDQLWSEPFGNCRRFQANVRPAPAEGAAEGVEDNGLFDDQTAQACGLEPGPGAAPGSRQAVAGRGAGPLTLRLRDVEWVDVFFALHDLTGQGYVVDADVAGRVNVDLEGVTPEQALAAAGLAVEPPGPLRRVSRSSPARFRPPSTTAYTGEPVSFSLKDADLRDVLALFGEVSGLKILGQRGLAGRVHLFARDLPWDRVFEGVLSSAGLTHVVRDDTLVIGSEPAVEAYRPPVSGAARPDGFEPLALRPSRRIWTPRLPQHAAGDFEVAGLGRSGGAWRAYAYGPANRPLSVEAGQTLFEGRVSAVGPEGITVLTDAWGPVDVPLRQVSPPLPFTVSKETTHVVGPLLEDGGVDYRAALDERYGRGATEENNAAPLLLRALGPKGVPESTQRRLGLPPLPEEGDYFQSVLTGDFGLDLARREGLDPAAARLAFLEQHSRAIREPWTEDGCPLVAAWIRANEAPLALVVEATGRPRFWLPQPRDESRAWIPTLLPHREAATALVARALAKLSGGDRRGAWADLMASQRLAGLLSQGPSLVERLFGVSIRSTANDGVAAVLSEGGLTAAEARGHLADLQSLAPLPDFREVFDVAERFSALEGWTRLARTVARRGPLAWDDLWEDAVGGWDADPPRLVPPLPAAAVDWDLLLRHVNRQIDAGLGSPAPPAEREAAAGGPSVDWERMSSGERRALLESLAGGRDPELRRRVTLSLTGRFPGLLRAHVAANEVEAQSRLLVVGLALAAHHAERGRYPARIEELAPAGALGADPLEGTRRGYAFRYHSGAEGRGYVLTAAPEAQNVTGVREFCLDATGRLRSSDRPGQARVEGGACPVEPKPAGERRP
jgi:hypothetical protein